MVTQVNVGLNRRVLRSGQTSSSYRRWYKVQHKNVELVIDAEFGAECAKPIGKGKHLCPIHAKRVLTDTGPLL